MLKVTYYHKLLCWWVVKLSVGCTGSFVCFSFPHIKSSVLLLIGSCMLFNLLVSCLHLFYFYWCLICKSVGLHAFFFLQRIQITLHIYILGTSLYCFFVLCWRVEFHCFSYMLQAFCNSTSMVFLTNIAQSTSYVSSSLFSFSTFSILTILTWIHHLRKGSADCFLEGRDESP